MAADPDPEVAAVHAPGVVRATGLALPAGYVYGVTRYADVILKESFPDRFDQLVRSLNRFRIQLAELQTGGGNRTPFVIRFDESLNRQGWGKRNVDVEKRIDGKPLSRARSHEIDMFAAGTEDEPYPGIGVEMEWSNKDPFFDRDLANFQALHREGALAVGVIVTRGPELQKIIKPVIRNADGDEKYGESTTHWAKLLARVDLGGGGECPLLLVGIETGRVGGIRDAKSIKKELDRADARLASWRQHFSTYSEAKTATTNAKAAALARLPTPPE